MGADAIKMETLVLEDTATSTCVMTGFAPEKSTGKTSSEGKARGLGYSWRLKGKSRDRYRDVARWSFHVLNRCCRCNAFRICLYDLVELQFVSFALGSL
jgi:hypothetical protein